MLVTADANENYANVTTVWLVVWLEHQAQLSVPQVVLVMLLT
jgi:hypothetical protein